MKTLEKTGLPNLGVLYYPFRFHNNYNFFVLELLSRISVISKHERLICLSKPQSTTSHTKGYRQIYLRPMELWSQFGGLVLSMPPRRLRDTSYLAAVKFYCLPCDVCSATFRFITVQGGPSSSHVFARQYPLGPSGLAVFTTHMTSSVYVFPAHMA